MSRPLALLVALAGAAHALAGQGYRLRLDTRMQGVAFRGVALDSIPIADTVTGPDGGPTTVDGFAVSCVGSTYCSFFRPGAVQRSAPFTTLADLSLWGLGVRGLSARATARVGVDLGSTDVWPGTEPALQLLEGYAEYAVERVTGRVGRQVITSRLGTTGFDGAWVTLRDRLRIDVTGYAGWGLERGAALPVTSPALNPLDDFQPRQRQLVAGGGVGWTSTYLDLRADYQREVDPHSNKFVSERFGIDAVARPVARFAVVAGADYDMAAGWWGSAELSARYSGPHVVASLGGRRYRPHFDLWTIWGAFSPVSYRAVSAAVAVTPMPLLDLRATGERYAFDDDQAQTPLTTALDDGWRWALGATLRPASGWTLDGGYHRELGPGAASVGMEGSVTYAWPARPLSVTLHGASLDRPLEFRFNDAVVHLYGVSADYQPIPRLRLSVGASRLAQDHRRPDAAAFNWDQTRFDARVVLLFGSGADLGGLPKAVRRMPGGRAER